MLYLESKTVTGIQLSKKAFTNVGFSKPTILALHCTETVSPSTTVISFGSVLESHPPVTSTKILLLIHSATDKNKLKPFVDYRNCKFNFI